MGDDCNVTTTRRIEDSPPSSSPKLGAARIKDRPEDCRRTREIPMEEKEKGESLLPRSRPESGEPGEELRKITKDKHVAGSDLPEGEADASDSLLVAPRGHRAAVPSVFPFSETKLRPDAPPFTPESLTRSGPAAAREVGRINDSVCGEPRVAPQPEIDDSCCFVNVDLRSPEELQEVSVPAIPAKPKQPGNASRASNAGIRDSRDHPVKDPGLKPFSLASTPRLKRSPPKIDLSVDSLRADIEMNDEPSVAVATESGANDPDIRETEPETGEPRVAPRGHWRIFRTAFLIGNRIQIAVFLASIVLCVVIVVYVFV